MNNLDFYIDAAKAAIETDSDRVLAVEMGLAQASISHWRTRRAWPQDEQMEKLALIGKQDPDVALVQLHIWKNPSVKSWQNIARKVIAALLLALAFSFTNIDGGGVALAAQSAVQNRSHFDILCDSVALTTIHYATKTLAAMRRWANAIKGLFSWQCDITAPAH